MEHERNNTRLYAKILGRIFASGPLPKTESRLGDTYEMRPVMFGVANPHEPVPFVNGRRPNYFGMLAESLWVLSDTSDVDIISKWNKRLRDYSDDGVHLSGAYGRRISPYVYQIIDLFRRDPNTRHAVLSIFHEGEAASRTKDLPCNVMVMFKIRKGMLDMTVVNRSNDIIWGAFTVNVPQFAMLQSVIAGALEIPVGQQWHMSDSLHLYTDYEEQKKTIERIRSHYAGGVFAKHLNVYDIWPQTRTREYVPRYDSGHMTRLLWDWSHCNSPLFMNDFISNVYSNTFLRVAETLLVTYAKYRRYHPSRMVCLEDLGKELLLPQMKIWCSDGNFPMDWVFGCLSTLVHDETTADLCMDIVGELDAYYFNRVMSSDTKEELSEYIEREIE